MNRIEQLNTFLKESPNDPFLLHAMALECVKIGDDSNAQKFFQQNLDTNINYVATYYHFGKLLERQGQEGAAINIYEAGMKVALQVGDQHAYSELRSIYEELLF